MHGGLSPHLIKPDDIDEIKRPTDVPDEGLLCDILWTDPTNNIMGWKDSERGVSYVFGPDVSATFTYCNNLDLIVRAHQVVEDGYEFTHKRKVITIFSAPNYCNEFQNCAAILKVSENLRCELKILRPKDKTLPNKNSRPKFIMHD